MNAPAIAEEKLLQRRAGIAARRALCASERKAKNAAICQRIRALDVFASAKYILAYQAFGGEADLSQLEQERAFAAPICLPDFALAAALPEGPDSWECGRYGIRTPRPERSRLLAPEELDLVLVPCTAFDAACRRVGMGKGYYDRYLARCVRAVKLGVAFECQRVERAAVEAHDWPLDGIVTEAALYTPHEHR